ncbi:hypothetical protein HAX54_035230 [Datura stramonium]|uniref:Helicase C-terminal domain-containing protein n=1 Tax=Datura stramonium TaxID=4076 RepID=A0ABS8SFG1_DATST|nr:hypothetical protein [Datura stramonium]
MKGNTPRNQDTDVLTSLEKVQTRLGRSIKRTILSKVASSNRRNLLKKSNDNDFYELVEHTLLKDDNFSRKSAVILGLRNDRKVLTHKGDFLEELPGLVDYTVLLKLHPKQKGRVDEEKIDKLLENLELREGVKAKFYLNLLQLCESKGEKMLVFSQYLLPLKFLERLTVRTKGYNLGKEIFMITGDSDSESRESSMERFNTSADARVFFGSIKACGEGISLVGYHDYHIDVHLNPSESIAKLRPEGGVMSPDFEMETVDINNCEDLFLESSRLNEDVVALYKRLYRINNLELSCTYITTVIKDTVTQMVGAKMDAACSQNPRAEFLLFQGP